MKILIAVVFAAVLTTFSYSAAGQPSIKFEQKDHKFGEIAEKGGSVNHEFVFTNQGDSPLIIMAVEVTCRCTKTSFTKKPVPPGQTGSIKVTYDPKKQSGTFHKIINVYSNSPEQRSILTISGTVRK